MPADLFTVDVMEQLVDKVHTFAHFRMLTRIQEAVYLTNGPHLSPSDFEILEGLAAMGLVDPGFAGPLDEPPYLWVSNNNGRQVLKLFLARAEEFDD